MLSAQIGAVHGNTGVSIFVVTDLVGNVLNFNIIIAQYFSFVNTLLQKSDD